MSEMSIMKQALGGKWDELPAVLKLHYQSEPNTDIGKLDIEYPAIMQWFLNVLYFFGALINRRGKAVPATVEKKFNGKIQYWKRTLDFPDGKKVFFTSQWIYSHGNRLIEYVNPLLGLCMAVTVKDGKLFYEGKYYVIKLGYLRIHLPEWLLLGHTTIIETQIDESQFAMDFRLHHPLFGQIYRYAGKFKATLINYELSLRDLERTATRRASP